MCTPEYAKAIITANPSRLLCVTLQRRPKVLGWRSHINISLRLVHPPISTTYARQSGLIQSSALTLLLSLWQPRDDPNHQRPGEITLDDHSDSSKFSPRQDPCPRALNEKMFICTHKITLSATLGLLEFRSTCDWLL